MSDPYFCSLGGATETIIDSLVKYTPMHCQLLLMCRVGLDLTNGCVCDNKKAGVLEPAVSKIKSLKFATEAAITILRIDDMIKMFPEEKKHPANAEELDY